MKTVIFSLDGKRFEVELENNFADYVQDHLSENGIAFDRNNEISKLLQLCLKTLKHNYDTEEQIKILLSNVALKI